MNGEKSIGKNGKVHVITGASAGIGRETALALGRRGDAVVLCARRADRLQQVATEVEQSGGKALAFAADVSDEAQVCALIRKTLDAFGRIDVLMNNAGVGLYAPVAEITSEQMERIWRVNFMSTFYCIKEVLPVMRRQKSGHIITVASMAGKRATPLNGAYCSTKFAQIGFMESLRIELYGSGIHSTVVCPGPTETEFLHAIENPGNRSVRYYGPVQTPVEVAKAIVKVIDKPVAEIFTQKFGRSLIIVNAVFPGFVDWVVRKRVKKKLFEEEVS